MRQLVAGSALILVASATSLHAQGPDRPAAFPRYETALHAHDAAAASLSHLRADLRRAASGSQWKKGAVIGTIVLGVAGAILGNRFCESGEGNDACTGETVLGGVLGAGVGFGIGGIIGSGMRGE